jgi:predicted transcriptional regulator YdeE
MALAKTERSRALVLAGRGGTFAIGPSPGIKDLWASFMSDFGRIDGQIGLKAYGVCHTFKGAEMDYLACVEVANAGNVPGYLTTLIIPARREAVFVHSGRVETLSATWAKIFSHWLPAENLQVAPGPQFEAYDFSADDVNAPIEIHIPVA